MRQKRTLVLLGSAFVGIVAVVLIFLYVRSLENSRNESDSLVTVYVADSPISEGSPGEREVGLRNIVPKQRSLGDVPTNAITSTAQIEGKVALLDIAPNTVITRSMFVNPEDISLSFQARLSDPSYVAVSVSLDAARAAGGFISPGDFVNMMLVSEDDGNQRVSVLFQKVRVLAVGDNATIGPREGGSVGGNAGVFTFEVPQEAASIISAAAASGNLYLTLVPNDYVPTPTPSISSLNIGAPGEDPNRLTPYGPDGFPRFDAPTAEEQEESTEE